MRTTAGRLHAKPNSLIWKTQPIFVQHRQHILCRYASNSSSTTFHTPFVPGDTLHTPEKRSGDQSPARRSETNSPSNNDASTENANDSSITKWSLDLIQRHRAEGVLGVQRQWEILKREGLRLPTSGPSALLVWSTLLERGSFLWGELFEHYLHLRDLTGQTYDQFYSLLVGRCLMMANQKTIGSQRALLWHKQFEKHNAVPEGGLRGMIKEATVSRDSLKAFEELYKNSKDGHCVYDALMPALLGKNWHFEAVRWHKMLLELGDHPSGIWTAPEMEHLEELRRSIGISESPRPALPMTGVFEEVAQYFEQPPAVDKSSGRYNETDQETKSALPFSRADLSIFMGKTLAKARPRELSDEFCARAFATRAFSVDAIIKGLALLTTARVGPLALREMAIRTEGSEAVLEKLESLRAASINLKDCVFSKAVVKLATDKRDDLLRSLLDSDQHPDVLEDAELQKQLLGEFVSQQNWREVHRTLYILTMFHGAPELESWNILLQQYALQRNLQIIPSICAEMVKNRIGILAKTLTIIRHSCLPRRRPGHLPDGSQASLARAGLFFLKNLWFQLFDMGMELHPERWHEIIRRFGMGNREFNRVEEISLRLAELYGPKPTGKTARLLAMQKPRSHSAIAVTPQTRSEQSLGLLFTPALQAAIVSWGFKEGMKVITWEYYGALKHERKGRLSKWAAWNQRGNLWTHLRETDNVYFPNRPPGFQWAMSMSLPPPEKTYLQGIILLEKLRLRGVAIDIAVVRKTVKRRLFQLFGLKDMSTRRANRTALETNPYKLEEMVWEIEKAWTGPTLFPKLYERTTSTESAKECDHTTAEPPPIPHQRLFHEEHQNQNPSLIQEHADLPIALNTAFPIQEVKATATDPSPVHYYSPTREKHESSTGDFYESLSLWSPPSPRITALPDVSVKASVAENTADDIKCKPKSSPLLLNPNGPPKTSINEFQANEAQKSVHVQFTAAIYRNPPPMLQGLVELTAADKFWSATTEQLAEERIKKRKELHFALFGRRPNFGHRRGRPPEMLWAQWVDTWARRYEVPKGGKGEPIEKTSDPFKAYEKQLAREKQLFAFRTGIPRRGHADGGGGGS